MLHEYEQSAQIGEPSESKRRFVSAVTWFEHFAHLKQSTWKKEEPKATTKPPCSVTADFLQPGHILSSMSITECVELIAWACQV